MMHTGTDKDGKLLFPAMPYPAYTKVTRNDSDAIYAYYMSLEPVRQPNRPHSLRFPYNNRELLVGWRSLFFKQGEYVPNTKQSSEWNRGAYLVDGLAHCAMCRSATNMLGGSSESQVFAGGLIPNQFWYAPSLTSNRKAGLGDWEIKDIVDVLRAGTSARGSVYGPDGRGDLPQGESAAGCAAVLVHAASIGTATDAVHGFIVGRSNANAMLIPGYVATFTTTFPAPWEMLMPCHKSCGTGMKACGRACAMPPAKQQRIR